MKMTVIANNAHDVKNNSLKRSLHTEEFKWVLHGY